MAAQTQQLRRLRIAPVLRRDVPASPVMHLASPRMHVPRPDDGDLAAFTAPPCPCPHRVSEDPRALEAESLAEGAV